MLKRLWDNLQMRLRPAWQRPAVAALYRTAARQARDPALYTQGGVPDSIDGRFDMLCLHLVLLMLRLDRHEAAERRAATALRQHLFDLLAADMDRSLREMGVGDMGIARRVQAMGEAYYGRLGSYAAALKQPADARRAALMTALDKNLYGTVPTDHAGLNWMADYVLALQARLDQQALAAIFAGAVDFAAEGTAAA